MNEIESDNGINCKRLLSWFWLRCGLCPWQGFVFPTIFFVYVSYLCCCCVKENAQLSNWELVSLKQRERERERRSHWPFETRYSFSKKKKTIIFSCPGENSLRGCCVAFCLCKFCACVCVCVWLCRGLLFACKSRTWFVSHSNCLTVLRQPTKLSLLTIDCDIVEHTDLVYCLGLDSHVGISNCIYLSPGRKFNCRPIGCKVIFIAIVVLGSSPPVLSHNILQSSGFSLRTAFTCKIIKAFINADCVNCMSWNSPNEQVLRVTWTIYIACTYWRLLAWPQSF